MREESAVCRFKDHGETKYEEKKKREREKVGVVKIDGKSVKRSTKRFNYVDENASTRLRFDELSGSRKRDIPGKLARVTQFGKPRDESNRAFLERAELIIANRGKD